MQHGEVFLSANFLQHRWWHQRHLNTSKRSNEWQWTLVRQRRRRNRLQWIQWRVNFIAFATEVKWQKYNLSIHSIHQRNLPLKTLIKLQPVVLLLSLGINYRLCKFDRESSKTGLLTVSLSNIFKNMKEYILFKLYTYNLLLRVAERDGSSVREWNII